MPWPELTASYQDEFGPIDVEVYRAAGEIWPQAERLSLRLLGDVSAGQRLMLKTAAAVTQRRKDASEPIDDLKGYVFTSFRRLLLATVRQENSHRDIESHILALDLDGFRDNEEELQRKILIHEILKEMDPWTHSVFEWLCLGYRFEEIAPHLNMKANVLRSRYSKQIRKLRDKYLQRGGPPAGSSF